MAETTPNVMSWDEAENRVYEYGVSKGVLYRKGTSGAYDMAEPWNGLINVTDSPSGAESTKLWADGIEYAAMRSAEQYGASVEAYTYPDGFAACDGSAQPVTGMYLGMQNREIFGLCWRTEIGNADDGMGAGYKLHLAYGLTAAPSEQSHDTINDSPDAGTMSWDLEGSPVEVGENYKPTCKIVIDSTKVDGDKLAALEAKLYGTPATTGESASDGLSAYLPLPAEVMSTLAS